CHTKPPLSANPFVLDAAPSVPNRLVRPPYRCPSVRLRPSTESNRINPNRGLFDPVLALVLSLNPSLTRIEDIRRSERPSDAAKSACPSAERSDRGARRLLRAVRSDDGLVHGFPPSEYLVAVLQDVLAVPPGVPIDVRVVGIAAEPILHDADAVKDRRTARIGLVNFDDTNLVT